MTSKKSVVAVILNYNDAATTLTLIDQLKACPSLDQILIVDNASTDDSLKQLTTVCQGHISVISAPSNKGYACGNNLGLRYAASHYDPDIVMIANPDIVIDEATIKAAVSVLRDAKPTIACVAPKMLLFKGHMESAWKCPTYTDMLLNAMIPLRPLFKSLTSYSKNALSQDQCRVEVLAGSLFFAKAAVLKQVDYFDERTFLYGEENILGYRLKAAGYGSLLLNTLSYQHHHSLTITKNIGKVKDRFMIAFNSDMVYLKDYLKVSSAKLVLFKGVYGFGLALFIGLKQIQKSLSR